MQYTPQYIHILGHANQTCRTIHSPRTSLQGRSQLKALAVFQKSTQKQALAGSVRSDTTDAADGFVDAGQHVHPGVGDDDQLLVVVGVAAVVIVVVVLSIIAFGGILNSGNGVGFGIVTDVAREEEGEGPMGAAGEAVHDFILLAVVLVGGGGSLRRCVRHVFSIVEPSIQDEVRRYQCNGLGGGMVLFVPVSFSYWQRRWLVSAQDVLVFAFDSSLRHRRRRHLNFRGTSTHPPVSSFPLILNLFPTYRIGGTISGKATRPARTSSAPRFACWPLV